MKPFSTLFSIIFFLCSCKGQKKGDDDTNFLDAKFQATGFFIPDISNPYPTYTY